MSIILPRFSLCFLGFSLANLRNFQTLSEIYTFLIIPRSCILFRIVRSLRTVSSKFFLVFSFDFAGKNLAERQGIAGASFWQILVQIRLQKTRQFMFIGLFVPEWKTSFINSGHIFCAPAGDDDTLATATQEQGTRAQGTGLVEARWRHMRSS